MTDDKKPKSRTKSSIRMPKGIISKLDRLTSKARENRSSIKDIVDRITAIELLLIKGKK